MPFRPQGGLIRSATENIKKSDFYEKIITAIFMACLLSMLVSACASAENEDISAFTANIDRYWEEIGIDDVLKG